ncbi:pyocin knob domain-containing protein [Pseudomonas protegens]|uniref:pyocin knob domain-containing protein n=1 Tax=Pseudomonas protegens TaxID=380021 RepID=UPI00069FE600|nr:pyocin knob domain-containing protein [Pseudomonas protegens]
MSIDPVNIGSTPNDGSGHDLRSGGAIINANFAQLDARTAAAQAKADAAVPGSELGARVRSTTLAGLGSLVNAAIVATDTVLQAFAKLQAQINQSIKKGEFGLGGDTGADAADCNLITKGGYHKVTSATLNQPGQGGCSLQHVSHSPGFWTQLAFGQGAGAAMWLRSQAGVAPGPWGRVLKTGDYGIGTKDTALIPGNNLAANPETGIYGWDTVTAGAPTNVEGGVVISASRAAAWGCKLIMSINSDKVWYKRWSAGSDQLPVRLLMQGDFGIGAGNNAQWYGESQNPDSYRTQGDYVARWVIGGVGTVAGLLKVSAGIDGDTCFQSFQNINGAAVYHRSQSGGTWSPWFKNLVPGEYGLGAATSVYRDNIEAPTVTEFNRFGPPTVGRPTDGFGTVSTVAYDIPSGNWTQFALTSDASYCGFRGKINGTTVPWRRLDTQNARNGAGEIVKFADGTMIMTSVRNTREIPAGYQGSTGIPLPGTVPAGMPVVCHASVQPISSWDMYGVTATFLAGDASNVLVGIRNGPATQNFYVWVTVITRWLP